MIRTCITLTALLLVTVACGDTSGGPSSTPASDNGPDGPSVTAVARPPSVPESAHEIERETTIGRIVRQANEAPQTIDTRALLTAACQQDVMVLWTDEETVYAALPCDRFWDDAALQAFSGQEIAITLTVDDTRFQIFIETVLGGQAEFTVGGIWIE